ncbi:MAG: cytochrome c oxidase subunit II [Limimaricola sp.]|uniref:cytochrome c oxidase subunit II n=1 Tax=Limimaricola sp. TaxID=2211665 RepID=UPI001D45B5A7|nr:cytochrome c oxidase subunit II [Limimaricola sp.]MBI1419008.1 cytochrome c oxidase subunit II [Limimaricola sp.]
MRLSTLKSTFAAASGLILAAQVAAAQEVNEKLSIVGAPTAGGTGFQTSGTEMARDVHWLDGMILTIITCITIFVTLLLIWVAVRYNSRSNPTPAKFTHNSPLEIAWTIVPVVILVFIGAFSLPVLFKQEEIPQADMTVKVTGHQWYWTYEYPDDKVIFDSYMIGTGEGNLSPAISDELHKAGYTDAEFRLAADNALVVPVNKTVVVQVTGGDVIHGFYIPSFGVHIAAVPGRLAEVWFKADKEGIYFGQCSALCGQAHSAMPITVKVVSQQAYDEWLAAAKVQNPAS